MEHKTIRAAGLDFAYLEEGQGPLVLLLHGFPDTAHTWDRTRTALAAAGFRAVSPFMRGYAPTEVPKDGDYRPETLAADVAALIGALGGGEKAIVVGHDWGAAAAYGAAILHPDRVRMLVTLAIPHPGAVKPSLGLLWKARHFITLRLPGALERVRKNNFAEIDVLVRRWSREWDVPPGETDAVKKAFSSPGSLEAAIGYYKAVGLSIPKSQRGKVRMPSVAFAGTSDLLPPSVYERARRFFEGAYEVVIMPGGHFLHREHPDRFHAELIPRLPPPTSRS